MTLTDTKTKAPNSCRSVKLTGRLRSGSGLSGVNIGSVTGATLGKCRWVTLHATFTAHGLPWQLNAVKYDSANGVTTGSIQGIDMAVSGVECSFNVDGTEGGANDGLIEFTYTNSTGKLKLQAMGGNLHFHDVLGCLGVVSNDDPIAPSGSLTLSSKQKISSP
jgi:hypothetical protein